MISPGDLLYDPMGDRIGWVVSQTSEEIYLIEWANGNLSSYFDWAVERFKKDLINKGRYDRLCLQKSVN